MKKKTVAIISIAFIWLLVLLSYFSLPSESRTVEESPPELNGFYVYKTCPYPEIDVSYGPYVSFQLIYALLAAADQNCSPANLCPKKISFYGGEDATIHCGDVK